MKRIQLCSVLIAAPMIAGLIAHLTAQSPPTPARQPRQIAYLKASNPDAGDHFGNGGTVLGDSVTISGDGNTIAIGAPNESSGASGINGTQNDDSLYSSGAVYVFARRGNAWAPQAYVKASNPGQGDEFGHVVALSADGNTMAVSAYFEAGGATGINANQADNSIPQAGAVYVFIRRGNTWSQQAYIKASNAGEAGVGENFGDGDQFGFSLAISDDGNTIAAGAITEDSGAAGIHGNQADNSRVSTGAVYVFSRMDNTWSQQAYVKPSNPDAGDLFGYSVSLSADGNTLAVGSFDEDGSSKQINGPQDNMLGGTGAAYVFTRAGGAWQQQAYVKASTSELNDSWGVSIAISDDGNTVALGALDEDCPAVGVNPPRCGQDGVFASGTSPSMGAVAVFVRQGTVWTEQVYLKPSNTGLRDWFGSRLAISGDGNTLAVPSQLEDSASRGINGRQDDESGTDAGVVYLFSRGATAWTQQAFIKGSNTEMYDEFGSSVALSRDGRTMVVGARGEDSSARGVNGNQADNSIDEAGAAYVFSSN